MKYLITESQIDNFVYQYLEDVVDPNREGLITYHSFSYDEDGVEYEDLNRIIVNKSYGEGDEEDLFLWYSKEYFGGTTEVSSYYKRNCPLVDFNNIVLVKNLNSHFRDKWYSGFKKWFTDKTGLPVNKLVDEL